MCFVNTLNGIYHLKFSFFNCEETEDVVITEVFSYTEILNYEQDITFGMGQIIKEHKNWKMKIENGNDKREN